MKDEKIERKKERKGKNFPPLVSSMRSGTIHTTKHHHYRLRSVVLSHHKEKLLFL